MYHQLFEPITRGIQTRERRCHWGPSRSFQEVSPQLSISNPDSFISVSNKLSGIYKPVFQPNQLTKKRNYTGVFFQSTLIPKSADHSTMPLTVLSDARESNTEVSKIVKRVPRSLTYLLFFRYRLSEHSSIVASVRGIKRIHIWSWNQRSIWIGIWIRRTMSCKLDRMITGNGRWSWRLRRGGRRNFYARYHSSLWVHADNEKSDLPLNPLELLSMARGFLENFSSSGMQEHVPTELLDGLSLYETNLRKQVESISPYGQIWW